MDCKCHVCKSSVERTSLLCCKKHRLISLKCSQKQSTNQYLNKSYAEADEMYKQIGAIQATRSILILR
jgi:hypothetical protein